MSYLKNKEYKIITTDSFEIIHACSGCSDKESFINTNRFRVNANGNKLDIWLIYQCEKCKHTLNIPIYERISPAKIDPAEYNMFLENNSELAHKYGTDITFLKSRKLDVDIQNGRFSVLVDSTVLTQKIPYNPGISVVVQNETNIKFKAEKIVSMVFDISRCKAKKMIKDNELIVNQENQSFRFMFQ